MPVSDQPVTLTGPETYRLADMHGVLIDLRQTTAIVKQLERRRDTEKLDLLLLECMQDSALIHYGRCYSGGWSNSGTATRALVSSLMCPRAAWHAAQRCA